MIKKFIVVVDEVDKLMELKGGKIKNSICKLFECAVRNTQLHVVSIANGCLDKLGIAQNIRSRIGIVLEMSFEKYSIFEQ